MSELDDVLAENARLRARVAELRSRTGADLRYVFVVTYGRSGSTLVQGLLNAIPGYLVRGENRDALHHLYLFHRTLVTEKAKVKVRASRQPTHPFFGMADVPLARSLLDVRRLALDTVLRPEPDTRVTGFKEIRWYHDDVADYVAWLREVFPGARFVVNTRDHAAVLRSKWWATGDAAENAERLAEIERGILDLAAGLGDAAFRLHYDDYMADPTTLRPLYAWLGEPWDEESVRATLAVRHSF